MLSAGNEHAAIMQWLILPTDTFEHQMTGTHPCAGMHAWQGTLNYMAINISEQSN